MKRLIEEVDQLGEEDFSEFYKLVEGRKRGRSYLTSERFLLEGREVFEKEILERLTREIPLNQLYPLTLVNKTFYQCVHKLTHLNIYQSSQYAHNYWTLFMKDFPEVVSVKSHFNILLQYKKEYFNYYRSLKSLEIIPLGQYEGINDRVDVDSWTSLERLILPDGFHDTVHGLTNLTNLTSLKCSSASLWEEKDLYKLTKLKELRISGLSWYHNKLVKRLPSLSYLESEYPGHFTGFTGFGILQTEYDGDDGLEPSEMLNVRKTFDSIFKNATSIRQWGEWKEGIFTGNANIQYDLDEEELIIKGPMLNGKFHGFVSTVNYEENILERGDYQNGVKHGFIHVYRFKSMMYWIESNLVLLRRETWKNGILTETDLFDINEQHDKQHL